MALAEVFRNALELVAVRAASGRIALAVDRPEPALRVLGDGPRLEQVLVNLLQNALDAVSGRPGPRVAVVLAEAADGSFAIEVRDNGPGIPEDVRTQVFDAFFTTKSDGLGLGLALARGIVEDCGGSLACRADPAGGTVFRIELPGAATVTMQERAAT